MCAGQKVVAEGEQIERGWRTVGWKTCWHMRWGPFRGPLAPPTAETYSTAVLAVSDYQHCDMCFSDDLCFMRKRKRKYHTLVRGASVFHSPSLFFCPRLPAIPRRLLLQGSTQHSHFLPLLHAILSRGSPSPLVHFSPLHLLTRALISQRSNNTAALSSSSVTHG